MSEDFIICLRRRQFVPEGENFFGTRKPTSLKMEETTPLGKWSGRPRTNLRLVLSSPRENEDRRRGVFLRKRSSYAGCQSRPVTSELAQGMTCYVNRPANRSSRCARALWGTYDSSDLIWMEGAL